MQSSKKRVTTPKKRASSVRAGHTFKEGELALLFEPEAPFGELCFVRVEKATPEEVVAYYGQHLQLLRPARSRVWASRDGQWNLEPRNAEREAASLARLAPVAGSGRGPVAAK